MLVSEPETRARRLRDMRTRGVDEGPQPKRSGDPRSCTRYRVLRVERMAVPVKLPIDFYNFTVGAKRHEWLS